MNISPIFNNKLNNSNSVQNEKAINPAFAPRIAPQLAKDTVSFSGKEKVVNSFFLDVLGTAYQSQKNEYQVLASKFHKALQKICSKFEAEGFTYDPVYNSKSPVKDLKSFLDKVQRQGDASDKIRGTVYWADQSNVPSFKKFIDAMDKEGFEVAVFKKYNDKTGKFTRMPDIEIRQNGVEQNDLSVLHPLFQKAEISRPRESSYSDWQVKFVPKNRAGKNEDRIKLEVIFLYGKKYAEAKSAESKYVYNITRAFKKLHIDLNENNHAQNTPGRRIAGNIQRIMSRLIEDISKPLYENAKITDLKIKDQIKQPVGIDQSRAVLLKGLINGIKQKLPLYYRQQLKKLDSDEYIIDVIKSAPNFVTRANKEISTEEIKTTRSELKRLFNSFRRSDEESIEEARLMLDETLKTYKEKK